MIELKGKILAGKILVQPKDVDNKTFSGIIIPDSAKEKPQVGKVILVGSPQKDEPMEISVGDIVFYGKYSGTELNMDGTDYLLMSQTDVLFFEIGKLEIKPEQRRETLKSREGMAGF